MELLVCSVRGSAAHPTPVGRAQTSHSRGPGSRRVTFALRRRTRGHGGATSAISLARITSSGRGRPAGGRRAPTRARGREGGGGGGGGAGAPGAGAAGPGGRGRGASAPPSPWGPGRGVGPARDRGWSP